MWVAWVGGAAQAGAGLVWARGLAAQGPGTGARRVQCVEGEGMWIVKAAETRRGGRMRTRLWGA